jgi:2-polyprenyl-3-methyl-5-hydroxy-6-metoxy-1,4-benzoquinol methylase
MMFVSRDANPWDEHASRYQELVAEVEQIDLSQNALVSEMLELLGDVSGRDALDACCGEGFFSRILASRGARVTAVDLSSRLIEMARERQRSDAQARTSPIDYRVGDLSRPWPDLEAHFDLIASYLALNDVRDHKGFAHNLHALGKPGSRTVLAFNNPYSSVVRGHVKDYFDSGALGVYGGLSSRGVPAHYYHRTLEEYLDALLGAGFRLVKLADVSWGEQHSLLPEGTRFPYGLVLALEKAP